MIRIITRNISTRRFVPAGELTSRFQRNHEYVSHGTPSSSVAETSELVSTGETSGGGNAFNNLGLINVVPGLSGPNYGNFRILIPREKVAARMMPIPGTPDLGVIGPITLEESPEYTTEAEINAAKAALRDKKKSE